MPPFTRALCGAVKACEANFASGAFHVAYWNLTLLSPGSRQPCWRSSCHFFKRALARVPSGATLLLPSRSTKGVKPSDGGLPPYAGPTNFLPSRPHDSRSCQILRSLLPDIPIRLQDPRLNWVPGAPPMNTLMLTYMLYAALGLLQPVRGLYGGVLALWGAWVLTACHHFYP